MGLIGEYLGTLAKTASLVLTFECFLKTIESQEFIEFGKYIY